MQVEFIVISPMAKRTKDVIKEAMGFKMVGPNLFWLAGVLYKYFSLIFSISYCCVIVAQKIFLEQNSSEYVFLGTTVHCIVSQWPLIDGLFGRAFAAGLRKLELSPFRHKCR